MLSAEDQNFFGHEGVDWDAIQKSLEKDVEKRRFVRGGSTITQQLAKNLYFGTHKTVTRKLRELIVARWLESDLTKAHILALYLNVIEWGDGVYGCEAAARRWYGKSASALSAPEAPQPAGEPGAPRARHAPRAVADGARGVSRARRGRPRRGATARGTDRGGRGASGRGAPFPTGRRAECRGANSRSDTARLGCACAAAWSGASRTRAERVPVALGAPVAAGVILRTARDARRCKIAP